MLDTIVTFQGCLDICFVCDATRQRDYVCKLHVKRHVVHRNTTCKAGPGCRDIEYLSRSLVTKTISDGRDFSCTVLSRKLSRSFLGLLAQGDVPCLVSVLTSTLWVPRARREIVPKPNGHAKTSSAYRGLSQLSAEQVADLQAILATVTAATLDQAPDTSSLMLQGTDGPLTHASKDDEMDIDTIHSRHSNHGSAYTITLRIHQRPSKSQHHDSTILQIVTILSRPLPTPDVCRGRDRHCENRRTRDR